MRIALVLDRFDPDHGGLEQWAWRWTTWLLDRGHEVTAVAAEARADLGRDRLTVHALGGAGSRHDFAARVAAFLSGLEVDLVHDLGVGWRCDLLQPQFGTRLADDRRNLASLPPLRRFTARFSGSRRRRLADIRRLEHRQYVEGDAHVVAVSALTRDDLAAWHGLPADRVTVIHNGVDAERFAPVDLATRAAARRRLGADRPLTILFAAHNFRLKGLGTVLRALARLRDRSIGLLVVGRGPVAPYARLADRLGIAAGVTFTGWIPDVRDALAAANAFVQPTFHDPCSLVVLEAAASGLAVLTSRFNGAAELFREGESAWIVGDPADDRDVAARIAAWHDAALRDRMAAAARAVAAAATHDRACERLFDLCRRTANRRGASR